MCKFLPTLFICLCLAAGPSLGAEPPGNADEKTLRHLKEQVWPKAYREQDSVLLGQILDDSFQMITASGEWSDKASELASLAEYQWSHDSFEYQIKRLDIYPNGTAVVAGEGRAKGEGAAGPYCLRYQSSNVLVRRSDSWKAILSHVSGVSTECDQLSGT